MLAAGTVHQPNGRYGLGLNRLQRTTGPTRVCAILSRRMLITGDPNREPRRIWALDASAKAYARGG
jgi:hypothetical protein